MKRIIFTVINDLSYDRRMIRICNSLADAGYDVLLVGIGKKGSLPLEQRKYRQKRLYTPFTVRFGLYAWYNFRLLWYLLFQQAELICCIDLDTMLPVWLTSKLKGTKRVYDAHEYFSQQKEVITRPRIYKVWHWIERKFVPRFKNGYCVSESIIDEFKRVYGVEYELVRNIPPLKDLSPSSSQKDRIILYQGAVNEARGLEFLVPAMKQVDTRLIIYGDGNFMDQTKELITANNLEAKVLLMGKVLPEELEGVTKDAYVGINLVEYVGLNQYYSLANKFFDYMHNGIPQLTMDFPEYKKINDEFEVALLLQDLSVETIAAALNQLLDHKELYDRLQQNCLKAREVLNWQQEEKKLLEFYKKIFNRPQGPVGGKEKK